MDNDLLLLKDHQLHYAGNSVNIKNIRIESFLRHLITAYNIGNSLTLPAWQSSIANDPSSSKDIKLLTAGIQRNQMLRIITESRQLLEKLGAPVELENAHRGLTVGPWYLRLKRPMRIEIEQEERQLPPDRFLTSNKYDPARIVNMCQVIAAILNGDKAFSNGEHQESVQAYSSIEHLPLTNTASSLLQIRLARVLKLTGQTEKCYAKLSGILNQNANASEPIYQPIMNFARFLLARMDYDRDPLGQYATLLISLPEPEAYYHGDLMTQMHWHNMRALLLRRQIEQEKNDREVHHYEALSHYQEAIFLALWSENRYRVHDFILNLAYHLQTMLENDLISDTITVHDILTCYNLVTMDLIDDMSSNKYSKWDHIFFAEFYWKHEKAIHSDKQANAILKKYLNPQDRSFYTDTIAELKKYNELRQEIQMYFVYANYAERYLNKNEQHEIGVNAINRLRNSRELEAKLNAEGYSNDLERLKKWAKMK